MNIKKNVAEIYPLTPLQQGLLFHTEADTDGAYVVQTAYELRGHLNESLFKKAWELTIARHPVLRCLFAGLTSNKPVQVILKKAELSWSVYDWKNHSPAVCARRFKELTEAERTTGFAVDRPPLMRFYWLQLESDVVRFIWTYHHALLDGWSVPLVLRDVIHIYDALNKGLSPQLPPPAIYRNYISWLKQQSSKQAIHYWKSLLKDHTEPTQLNLSAPTGESETAIQELDVSFDKKTTSHLKAFCQQHRLTLNILCQGALSLLLERYSDTNNIVFGTTVSGRPSEISQINELIGAFINSIPVQSHINPNDHVIALLENLRTQQLERDQYSFLPLTEIQKCSQVNDGSPLFNTLFVFENFPVDPSIKQTLSDLEISRVLLEDKTSFPLTIAAKVTDVLSFNIQFKTSEYQQKDIECLIQNYQCIIEQMVNNHQSLLSELVTLQETQRQKLLNIGQGPGCQNDIDSVLSRFDAFANHHAEKIAIIDAGQKITYTALQAQANQLAQWLIQNGISKNQSVAICLPSGIKFIVSMIAILRAQACYVPIEMTQPKERIDDLMHKAKVAIAITDGSIDWPQTFNPSTVGFSLFDWSTQNNILAEQPLIEHSFTDHDNDSIAYIMFTSGTTGEPKAISIKQDSLANHIDDAIKRYSFNTDDRILQFSSMGFDVSAEEIWPSLCSGATLIIYDRSDLALSSFENLIAEQSITALDLPTSYWHTWVGSKLNVNKLTSLKKVIVGGEAARPQALRCWREQLPKVQWFNAYGPTETTISATVWQAPENLSTLDLLPIGSPIQNVTCLVLDQQQRLTPLGAVGELYIGGAGLTPGYFCRPDLDAHAFVHKTLNDTTHRYYRTGDHVHWDHDGQLIFHGRRDNQVKLRGYRIELSAIENELTQCNGVRQAHAAIQKQGNHPVLVAYLSVDLTSKVTAQHILNVLRQRLPGYMIPSALALLDALPLTSNGKIATTELPAITLHHSDDQKSPPTTALQKQLISYWETVLGNTINSIHSNFFELGGDSIHAIKIVSLAKQDGLSLQIPQLFEFPTVFQLAEVLQNTTLANHNKKTTIGEQPLSIWQHWLFKQQFIKASGPQLLSVQSDRPLTESQVKASLKIIIEHHACLRSEFVCQADKVIQRITPFSDIASYREINTSTPLNQQQLLQQLETLTSQLNGQSGTHVLNIQANQRSETLLLLLVFGCHLDEYSRARIQQHISSVINSVVNEEQIDAVSYDNDAEAMHKQLRKSANSVSKEHFKDDIEFWHKKQNDTDIFYADTLNEHTLQLTVVLQRALLEKIARFHYLSEEEVLAYLITSALSECLTLDVVASHVLRSNRDDAFWSGKVTDSIGDFRTLFPCPIESVIHANQPLDIKNFKQQFRKATSKSLGYLVGQYSNELSPPRSGQSLLICLSDLALVDQSPILQQLPNGIGDQQFGGKIRFVKTTDEIQLIWQVHNSQLNENDVKKLAELTQKTAQTMNEVTVNDKYTPIITSDFKHSPLNQTSLQKLWKELEQYSRTIGIDAIYPVTPLQRGMLFHSITNQNGAYSVQAAYRLKGSLDSNKLQQAWQMTLSRHPILRSFFWGIDSETPVQIILKHMDLNWNDENWANVNKTEFNRRFSALIEAERHAGFDNNQTPLMRMYCIRSEQDCHQFIWTYHHALLDGWSVPLVLRDVLAQYSALIENRTADLSTMTDYQSYAQWLNNKPYSAAIEYWQQELKGFLTPNHLNLPHAEKTTKKTTKPTNEVKTTIEGSNWLQLNQFCQIQQQTLNVACQAAWALLIHQYSGDHDVVFGTTVSGRSTEITGVNELIGAFINTVPVRVDLTDKHMDHLLKNIQQQQLEREEYCHLPLWEIQRLAEIEAGETMFDSLLVYENYPVDANLAHQAGNIVIEPISGHGDSNYSLTMVVIPGEKLDIRLRYRNINEGVAQNLLDDFASILNHMTQSNQQSFDWQIDRPDQPTTYAQLIGTTRTVSHKTVPEIFLDTVANHSDAPAIIDGEICLTYLQLNKRANALAKLLQTYGVTEKEVVSLRLPRGIDAIVSIIAIQKLGATYLPLDLSAPVNRLEQMLSISACRFLISNSQHDPKIDFIEQCILLDADKIKQSLLTVDSNFEQATIGQEHPIYINFTSGTQGEPKGVMIPQRAIARLVCGPEYVTLNNKTVMLHASNLAFDAATFEIWGALLNGSCLIAYSEEYMDLSKLNQHIQRYHINTMWLTAGLFQQWVNSLQTTTIPELNYILTGGDIVSAHAVKKLYDKFSNTVVINGYGPTETTTFACCYPIPRDHDWQQSIPIGKPIGSTQIRVVDDSLNTLAQGETGELLISGHGVALGYIGANSSNEDKFIKLDDQNHFRTGDKVRLTHNGLEFIGRMDRQVKIRGFRIELNEIDSVMRQIVTDECIVIAHGDNADAKKLYAYIEAKAEAYQESHIIDHIQKHLPDYMVPARLIFIDQFPLTKNGKIDQKQLLITNHNDDKKYSFKNNELKNVFNVNSNHNKYDKIKQIWSELLALDISDLSDDSHFFESGGDSIVAIQLVAKAFDVGFALSVQQIFKQPILKDMAACATPAKSTQELDNKHHGDIRLSPVQHWFFEHFSDFPNHWNQSVLLTVPKDLDLKKMRQAIASLTQHHDLLRARFTPHKNTWRQFIRPWDPLYEIKQVSLVNDQGNWQEHLESNCDSEQKSLDITTGKLLQLVHYTLPEDQAQDRLHIICHHLIVDGVSWRILLSDLMKAYHGKALSKTHSYRQWSQCLSSQMSEFKKEMDFWKQQCLATDADLHCDPNSPNLIIDEQKIAHQLSHEATKALLYAAPLAYNNSVEQTILTALLLALSQWCDTDNIRIDMEGHGRNGHADQLDLSNTLGWFTAIYPLRFTSLKKHDPITALKSIKEQLKSVPQGGVGFSALKYLSQDADVINSLTCEDKTLISFNYMGQMRTERDSEFGMASEASGSGNDPRQKRSHVLAFGGAIEKERLKLHCYYNENLHSGQHIQELLNNTIKNLNELISHCSAHPYAGATPSDFPEYPGIAQHQLNQLWQFAQKTPEKGRIQAIGQLTGPQQGMIFHSQMNTQEAYYVEQLSYRISGPLDAQRLKEAWQHVINTHDIFRVEFLGLDSESSFQIIRQQAHLNWSENNLSDLDTTTQESTLKKLIEKDRIEPFVFDHAPLMRLRLCFESQSSAILTWTYHHALMDGWSMPLVFKSLFMAYKDAPNPLESTKSAPSFRRYLQWLGEQDKTAAKYFWKQYLKGFTSPTPLTVKKDTPDTRLTGADEIVRALSSTVYDQLQRLCKKLGITLNAICQTAWAALLTRYSGEQDVLFAITSSGRPGDIKGINDIVGPFINTLPSRIAISTDKELAEILSDVHMQQANIDKFGYLSLTDIQSESEVPNGIHLFESIFAFENYPIDDVIKENHLPITFKPLDWKSQTNFPLTVIWAPGETLDVKIQFMKQHFDANTIKRLVDHYLRIIEGMANEQHPLKVNLLTVHEQQQMLNWNNTNQPYNTEQCIHQLFSDQTHKTPDAIALYFEQKQMTYQTLNQKSTALAHELHRQNLAHIDSLIAVCLPRGFDQVIACLGIMKAGGAYLPLDPKWPVERRQKILKKGRASAIIATNAITQELSTHLTPLGLTAIDPSDVTPFSAHMTLNQVVKPNNLAYVIFTSGSTGEPKGVMIEHRSAVNTFIDINTRFNVSPQDRVLAVSALTFDLSVYDLFGVLSCGAAAVLPNDDQATNVRSWARLVEQHKVSIWDTVPQLMNILLEEAESDQTLNIKSLRTIMMSGDWIPLDLPQRIRNHLPNASINSLGGATEGSIWSITHPIVNHDPLWKSVPYGKPMANQQFHILDDQDQPCPIGVSGHLYIGGIGVARGYWADSDRTARQFRAHPETGETIYWTGDLAKYGEDGTIEFLGRSDFQVKINGFRIELGEIETALNQSDNIIRSVVIAHGSQTKEKSLVAYVITESTDFDEHLCYQKLQENLPRYMLPSAILRLDKIPLSSNGKVDRNALPKPSEDQLLKEYIAPQSSTEITISETWQSLLKCEKVGINDNFFDLGGHSLLATQMVSRLARILNIEVPMEMVFRVPTVKSLAQEIDELLANTNQDDFEEGEL